MITWKEVHPHIGPSYWAGYLGEVKIFSINSSMSKNDDSFYLRCFLPGADKTGPAPGVDMCKATAELILDEWLRSAGLALVALPNLVALSAAYNRGYGEGKQGKDFPYAIALPCNELAQYKQGYAEGLATKHPD